MKPLDTVSAKSWVVFSIKLWLINTYYRRVIFIMIASTNLEENKNSTMIKATHYTRTLKLL